MSNSTVKRKRDSDFSAKIEDSIAYAKNNLKAHYFYWTNARFPEELDLSKKEYTKSPLRSFHHLHPPEHVSGGQLFRVSTNTSIQYTTIDGKVKRGQRKQFCSKHPCYLASYDKSTNQGVIFLGTSKVPDNIHRFVIVHSTALSNPKLLRTYPPNSFGKKTYLNISHPLQVQFAYFQGHGSFPQTIDEGKYYKDYKKPPLVSISNFITQPPDKGDSSNNGLFETSIAFDARSKILFWILHKEYHTRRRLDLLEPNDDAGGVGPDDDNGGAGPNDDNGGARPDDDNGRGGSSDRNSSRSGAGPSIDGVGLHSNGGGGSNGQDFSLCNVKDAPWGRVGDQRIGIDIPLVIEDMDSDDEMSSEELNLEKSMSNSDVEDTCWGGVGDECIGIDIPVVTKDIYLTDEMNLEEPVSNLEANDAPWGRVGEQRIGIDIPLVIEDMDSDSDEGMDSKSPDEFQRIDDVANDVKDESLDQEHIIKDEEIDSKSIDELQGVDEDTIDVKPKSFDQEVILTGPNQNVGNSSCDQSDQRSDTISKPYFVISKDFVDRCALLNYDLSIEKWRWTRQQFPGRRRSVISIEGLSYQHPHFPYYLRDNEPVRRIFNWHTKEHIKLPQFPYEPHDLSFAIIGMTVDTSVQPYAFKVIAGNDEGTRIYDSTTQSWTRQPSVPPRRSKNRSNGNANVACCKGVAFIIDSLDRIVLYNTEEDMWNRVKDPAKFGFREQLCGIGSWDDRVFSYSNCMSRTFEIRELVDMTNLEWKTFDAMPREMYSWLNCGEEEFGIDVSYCSESLLIWNEFYFSTNRFVLCNLAHKTWEKLELPQFLGEGSNPLLLGH